jgi:glutamate synthase domain-containing protein 1
MPVPIDKRKNAMPARELQQQLNTLREQLEQNPPLSEAEREDLHALMQQIELELELETKTQNSSLSDNVNLAVERFEIEHPTLAGTLRNIVQSLVSMGI